MPDGGGEGEGGVARGHKEGRRPPRCYLQENEEFVSPEAPQLWPFKAGD